VPPVERQHHNVTLAVLVAGGVSYALMQSFVIPALTTIQAALHTSETGVSWLLTAYLLSASVATPIAGRLGDMYGKERVLMVTLVLLSVGTLVSALASSLGPMIAGRVIQGMGGGVFPLAYGIIRDEFPRERVAQGIGLMSSLLGIGGALGLVLTGPVLEHLSYHWLFWLPLMVVVPVTVATHLLVPESPIKVPGKVNWLAASLLSAGIVIVLLAVSQAPDWGWGSARLLGGVAAGLAVLAAWIVVELRATEPLIDMAMMRITGVWTTNLVAFLVGVGMYSAFLLMPRFVQEPESTGYGFGASLVVAGAFMVPAALTQVLAGQFTGRLQRTVGSRAALLAGVVFTASAFLLLIVARSSPWEVYVASTLLGTGIGLAFGALANLIVENVRQDQTGAATGMNTVMRTLGGALGGQVVATVLASHPGVGEHPTSYGYGLAFGACAVALVIGIVVAALLVPRRATPAIVAATA
jgi:EmrB/QacA subfamily drug resistance transporter